MHPRTRSVLVVAVVAVVAAAPVAGIAPSVAAASSATPGDAVDRPALDDVTVEDDGSSDWPFLQLDDDDDEDGDDREDEDRDEDEDDEDRDEDEERDGADEDEREDRDGDEEDEGEDDDREDERNDEEREREDGESEKDDREDTDGPGDADRDRDDRGSDDQSAGGDGSPESDSTDGGDGTAGTDNERPSTDGRESGDQQAAESSDDQQTVESSDESQSTGDRGVDDEETAADTSEARNVRVDAQDQEDDETQEGDDGEGNATGNTTRNGTVAPEPDVGSATVTVLRTPEVVGQPLVVTATTTNEGTEAGRKVVQFEVEHEIVDNRTFVLQPNETKTVTFTHVFETPGNKTFEVDSGVNRFVTVEERRPNLSVSTVQVAPESVESGGDVTITAVVTNDGYANGSLPVTLELFGEVVGVKNVTLATGESAEVTFTRTLQAPGTYEATVGNETAEFRVVGDEANATTTDSVLESAAETPGFGVVAAMVGVVVAVALALGRRE